ncbi:MAG: fumarate hydratase [Thermotogota bacterium]
MFIDLKKYKNIIKKELIKANESINPDVKNYLREYKGFFSDILNNNYIISENNSLPLCQDTGIIEFFFFINKNDFFNTNIQDFMNSIVEEVYKEKNYRYSTVIDPFLYRKNSFDNLPAMVNIIPTEEKSKLSFLIKGGGSENLSFLKMLNPTINKDDLIEAISSHIRDNGSRACPPLVLGIGLGGTSEKAMLNSKISLLKNFNDYNEDKGYEMLEKEIENRLNNLNIGVQGLKEGKTVLSAKISTLPSHIASLSLAISVDCYLNRKGVVVFEK